MYVLAALERVTQMLAGLVKKEIKSRKKNSDKDLGFLRIGSLNVRVKKTTEAFSNFLMGGSSSTERLHKTWGSADNIQERVTQMLAGLVKKEIKSRKKNSDKDLGFLRIGSLNVRVKKTTEAFSNFLMGGSSSTERLHKTWGSADNIQEMDRQNMPPPKASGSRRRRGARRSPSSIQLKSTGSVPLISVPVSALTASEEHSQSTPSTPHQPRAISSTHGPDSDSDTACGFGDNWKNTV
ncbi:hypothetical protein B566_EDAN008461 [Ephemera danica]|nr:hypothetical protein B566_EDAN008461 [Ephemera danica]